MEDLFRIDYSSSSIRHVIGKLEGIESYLSKLSGALEYSENTWAEQINVVRFRELQVELNFRLERLLKAYAFLFIFRFGWEEFMSWRGNLGKLVSGEHINFRVSSINADLLPEDDRERAMLRDLPPYLTTLFETKVWTQDWIDAMSAE